MADRIRIVAGRIEAYATLDSSRAARLIARALPFTARAATWGEEIYFDVPVRAELDENSRDVVEAGELGYWPEGPSFCIFFGPTPLSRGKEIRAASKVAVFGRLEGDPAAFRAVQEGDAVRVEHVTGE